MQLILFMCIEMIPFFSSINLQKKVTWLRGIRDVAESGRSYIEVEGDFYRLVLKKSSYADSGTYIIKASNCHGSQKAYCTVRVRIIIIYFEIPNIFQNLLFKTQIKEPGSYSDWNFKEPESFMQERSRRYNKGL